VPLLKACLNGARRPSEHPALPVTPDQLARNAAAVAAAGADAVHLHVKDAAGADTLNGAALADVLVAVRAAVPGLPVGVTTGAWAAPDPAERVALLRSWSVLPDFASVNWHEDGAEDVAAALLDRGVGVEAGIWHSHAAAAWFGSPHRDACLRVLVELPDRTDDVATAARAERLVGLVAGAAREVLLHGEGASCWPLLELAARRGLAVRVGLEDTLVLPDGCRAPGNAALVRAARTVVTACDPARADRDDVVPGG
jgi:uncharacterized protein (DUF849 family)